MPQIDIYLISAQTESQRLSFICRLIDKISRLRSKLYIAVSDDAMAHTLDELLWTDSPHSFIPHALAPKANTEMPVLIGKDTPMAGYDTVLNLQAEALSYSAECQRILEVVSQEPEVLANSRKRYKVYQQMDYNIIIHDLKSDEKTHG